MKKLFRRLAAVLCAGLLMTSLPVQAEEEEEAYKLPSGYPVSWLAHEMEETDKALGTTEDREYASAAVGIFGGDEILYTGYFGYTDIDNGLRADAESVYEWGSISKTLVWVSVMQLYEQGKIDLDRDIREYLPDGFFRHLKYDDPITMLNLMNHNAGWQETARPMWKSDESKIGTLREELQSIEPAQIHRPGEVMAYSNYGAAVAGYIVECITGQDYSDYVHEHILDPLGMEHTAVNPAHSDNPWVYTQRARMHSYQLSLGNIVDLGPCLNYCPDYPAGSATGTLSDLMTYAQALADPEAPLFESPETQKLMYSGTFYYGDSDVPICAHGFWTDEHSMRTYGHDGATTSGQAKMEYDPETGIGVVVMVNEPNGNWYLNYTARLALGALSPDKYGTAGETIEPKGWYLNARDNFKGMLKFMPYLTAFKPGNFKLESRGNGLVQVRAEDDVKMGEETAELYGWVTDADGNERLQMSSVEYIRDRFYLPKLLLFTVYVLSAIISVFLLLVRQKQKKHHRLPTYAGERAVSAGRLFKVISFAGFLIMVMFLFTGNGGIAVGTSAVFGLLQMLCMAVFAVTAVICVLSFLKEKHFRYLFGIAGNVLCICTILYYELYVFWGI